MTDDKMKDLLQKLILKYVQDAEKRKELLDKIDAYKVKYILGEIDRVKIKEYSQLDVNTIKDLYFYYC